ncbi:MAG TPA: acireductone synthase [Alphaproteobacteria bacterium]|nr:acireductone synthase [Alphaproteobacteria bacterium]
MTPSFSGIRAVITDIEGTTSAISFVHEVLFPYACERLAEFVARRGREHDIRILIDVAKNDAGNPAMSDGDVVGALLGWIDEDRKNTALKALQGLIWEEGYRNGALKGHVYADAADALKRWAGEGIKLFVYSSGSIAAQKLIFGHSPFGDLTPLFAGYFDTTTGPKMLPDSYLRIVQAIGFAPAEVLFLSDSPEEITAAKQSGLHTVQFVRPGEARPVALGQASAESFADVRLA